ncbi:hypothetical protein [Corynebacterium epidermidicanis]|uniref:Uncharacterized protein n=1 Tax=Corynebacterium epidermidicanis TaxID=1050174 RepID=A0A0G3GPI3_9CORY|nr:hypothetical protein [Corynebacterium epidermidicanis]AKK03079.1 hypothetical protein CEPID_06090 [Corynebacterium epidermidicanis]
MTWHIKEISADTNHGEAPQFFDEEPRQPIERESLSGWLTVVGLHGNSAQFVVEIELSQGDPTIRSIEFTPVDGRITATHLRDFHMNELMDEVNSFLDREFPRKVEPRYSVNLLALRAEWPHGDLSKLFPLVEWVYNGAISKRKPATLEVARRFGVSRATASRMVAAARAAGHELSSPAPYKGSSGNNGEAKTSNR